MAVFGVDISEMNGQVDFPALQKAGVKFVIIRCGYGSDFAHQDDSRFQENVEKAERAGMPWGTYLYSYAVNPAMAKSEAQHTLRLLKGRKPPYGAWYDVEDAQQEGCDLVPVCEAYCTALEEAGLYAGIYSALSWWEGRLHSPRLDRFDKWVAQWAGSCGYKKPYGMWQYTDRLTIGGRVFDGDWAYKDYPALTKASKAEEGDGGYQAFLGHMERYQKEQAQKDADAWAKPAVEFVKARGLMQGDAGGGFRGRSPVARQELAQVLLNLEGQKSKGEI